ncbi:hypothetical protein [Xanthobacter versatilis]
MVGDPEADVSATAGRFLDAARLDETPRAKFARGNAIDMHMKA